MAGVYEEREHLGYRELFEDAPIAIWDEDFSSVRRFLDRLLQSGVKDLRSHFADNPDSLQKCIECVIVRHVNKQARAFYGATTEEELIRSLPSLFDERSKDIFIEELATLAEGATTFEAELYARTLKGERKLVQMNISLVPTPSNDWSRVVVTFTDLTERRRLEQNLRRTNDVLLRLNEDLEQFAYAAAHDLREPLRTIMLYTQVLRRLHADELGEPAQAALVYILDGARRMETLVHDLLSFAQAMESPNVPENVSVDSGEVLNEALQNLSLAIRESNAVIHVVHLPPVAVERSHVRQLFQNLVGNAIKYRDPDRIPEVRITALSKGAEVTFKVADNGMGIRAEYHSRIFGIFKRLHGPQVQGNGIGLALCKKIVEHYGGRIWVESAENAGATFYFTLPAAETRTLVGTGK